MATASFRDPIRRRLVPACYLPPSKIDAGVAVLSRFLGDVGDASMERACVLAVTVSLQRVLTAAEVEESPGLACARPLAIAGVPLRVLYHRGGDPAPSTLPCSRGVVVERPELLGLPEVVTCGRCDSCVARSRWV